MEIHISIEVDSQSIGQQTEWLAIDYVEPRPVMYHDGFSKIIYSLVYLLYFVWVEEVQYLLLCLISPCIIPEYWCKLAVLEKRLFFFFDAEEMTAKPNISS